MVFDFYDNIADNVDYYFITWDTSNTDGIVETFKDQNLIHFQVVDHKFSVHRGGQGQFYNGWVGPAFMQSMLMPHVRIQERTLGKKYDAFFDTRPDVLPYNKKILHGDDAGKDIPFISPEAESVYVSGIEIHKNLSNQGQRAGKPDVAIKDWFIMSRGKELEAMSARYNPSEFIYEPSFTPGQQIEYREIVKKKGMNLCTMDWVEAAMVRPCVFELGWNERNNWENINNESKNWSALDKEDKIRLCKKYGISISDYTDTTSITCKI